MIQAAAWRRYNALLGIVYMKQVVALIRGIGVHHGGDHRVVLRPLEGSGAVGGIQAGSALLLLLLQP